MEHSEDQAWQQPGLGSQLLSERDELLVQGAAVEKAAVLVDMVRNSLSYLQLVEVYVAASYAE